MRFRGRRFAAGALLAVVAQLTAALAVPLAACATAPALARSSVECCPAGSHPPGQCPLHNRESRSGGCRLTCAAQGHTPFIPGIAGVLPPSISILADVGLPVPIQSVDPVRISRRVPPGLPPPKSLP